MPGRYRLKKKIGSSRPTVSVFAAEAEDGRKYAIKIMAAAESDSEIKRCFEREVEALKRMPSHPNVVGIHDAGYRQDDFEVDFPTSEHYYGFFIVEDLIEGISLHDALDQHLLPPDEGSRLAILTGISQGVLHAHQHGVIHRDIKPHNVILRRDGDEWTPIVIDFGIAKIQSTLPSPYTLQGAGTRQWAPPEYLKGLSYSRVSDVFSFGLVGACLMSGEKLRHNGEHVGQVEISRELELLAGLSEPVTALLKECLQCKPEDRPQSFAIVADRLLRSRADVAPPVYCVVARQGTVLGYSGPPGQEHKFVDKDLRVGPLYIGAYSSFADGGKAYQLLSNSFEYLLALDKQAPDRSFYLVKARRVDPAAARMQRAHMLPVSADWDVYSHSKQIPSGPSIVGLLAAIDAHERKAAIRRQKFGTLRQKIRLWKDLLSIDADRLKNTAEAGGVAYESLESPAHDLWIFKGADLRKCDFDRDQSIAVATKGGSFAALGKVQMFDSVEGILTVARDRPIVRDTVPDVGTLRLDVSIELRPIVRATDALGRLAKLDCPESLQALLTEPDRVSVASVTDKDLVDEKLSESKKEALRAALGAKECLLVQGPPGTGKTRFIVALVREISRRWPHQRLLISSQTNVALDNALEGVAEASGDDIGIVRIGDPSKVFSPLVKGLQLGEQARRWAGQIGNKVASMAESMSKELQDGNKDAPVYSRAKELLRYEKEQAQWKEMQSSKAAELKSREESLKETLKDTRAQLEKLVAQLVPDPLALQRLIEEQQKRIKDIQNQADEADKIEALKRELADVAFILDEYSKKRLEAKSYIEKELGISIGDTSDSITTQIRKIETHLAESLRAKSDRVALLRQWQAKLVAVEPSLVDDLLAFGVTVVGATCVGSGDPQLRQRTFDWIIVDEAARANPGELTLPLLRGNRYVLVGDQKQLPPFMHLSTYHNAVDQLKDRYSESQIRGEIAKSLFESIFELANNSAKKRLAEQFRMCRPIGELISSLFYSNGLDNSQASEASSPYLFGDSPLLWLDTSLMPDRAETRLNPGFHNRLEAQLVRRLLTGRQAQAVLPAASLAILAPYRGQVELLKKSINGVEAAKVEAASTIDNFQGKQADFVVYSCVRSNQDGEIGFLEDIRRLTVALSRARRQLILIGDTKALQSARLRNEERNIFAEVLWHFSKESRHCKVISAGELQ